MGDVSDFGAERWARETSAGAHLPAEALAAAQRDLAGGELGAKHIIVLVAYRDGDQDRTRYYQAGGYDRHGQLGLLVRGLQIVGQ